MFKNKKSKFDVPLEVLFYISWRNVLAKRLRSTITILGVTIGIGAICFLVSLGLGLQSLVTKQVVGNRSLKVIDVSAQNSRIVKLNQEIAERIGGVPNVDTLGILYSQAGTINIDKSKLDSVVYGVDVPYQKMIGPTIVSGQLFANNDTNVGYINKATLDAVGIRDPAQVIGKSVTVAIVAQITNENGDIISKKIDQKVTVIGVIESGTGGEIYLPAKAFAEAGIQQYSQMKILAKTVDAIPEIRKQAESYGLQTASPVDTIDQVNQIFRYLTLVLLGFGTIGMVIAVLGMFNTLTISLLERTGEIGLLKELGGRKKDMRRLFYIEALILSISGAIAGIGLAVVAGMILNFVMNNRARSRGFTDVVSIFSTPWWLFLGLIAFMVAVGLLVVIAPARRAEKINPVDALRQE